MLPIIICDDNSTYLKYLGDMIKNFILIEALDMEVVLTTDSAQAVIAYTAEHKSPSVYFLDVELKDDIYDGITLAQKLRTYDPRGFIVFITTHDELSLMAFQYHVEAMDYIIKDEQELVPDRIRQCLLQAKSLFSSRNNELHKIITLHMGDLEHFIRQEDILCLQTSSKAHQIEIITIHGVYQQYTTLQDIKSQLDSHFFQCHKSCIINLAHIQEIDKKNKTVTLTTDRVCQISTRLVNTLCIIVGVPGL